MTDDERLQVKRVLELRGSKMAEAVAELATAEQLHQWLLHYNVNDGFLPCLALVRHPACDRGTALMLYWRFSDCLMEPRDPEQTAKAAAWDAHALLVELGDRLTRNDFASAEICFDPVSTLNLTTEAQKTFIYAGVPEGNLQAVGSRAVEREPLG
ncbi:hypothetical protein AKJ09_09958 [Labilithrix luteola]|uniref:DUF4274 domain-containing protein n=1 Tax=Labilithrix luteola TaxID=1391654 RepID=A0A0K1QD01_9BACT|nr:DUF4274 domain-containing protein [Labilithrix luteola]AKV03295.1 hypothetical protein AKJ09_09958 [Labilithrix luteola]